jgi:hypothetical protein
MNKNQKFVIGALLMLGCLIIGPIQYVNAQDDPIPTTEWISVYCAEPFMNELPLAPGDTIRAYDPDGILCGKDVVKPDGSFGFMPVYHDDVFTPFVDEGAHPGDVIKFTINHFESVTYPIVIWTFHGDFFEVCDFNSCGLVIVPDSLWMYYAFAIDPMSLTIYLGNLPLGHTVDDIDTASIRVNETIVPTSMIFLDSFPDFDGRVLEIVCSMVDFLDSYPLIWDSTYHTYLVTGNFNFKPNNFNKRCEVWIRGHISGDGNGDGKISIFDISYLIAYLYLNGPAPKMGDASVDVNHSNEVNILDISYLLSYIYLNGPPPFCPQTNY